MKIDYCVLFSCNTTFPLSLALILGVLLDSRVSEGFIWSYKATISWARSSTAFITKFIFLSISAMATSAVTFVIMIDTTSRCNSCSNGSEAEVDLSNKGSLQEITYTIANEKGYNRLSIAFFEGPDSPCY